MHCSVACQERAHSSSNDKTWFGQRLEDRPAGHLLKVRQDGTDRRGLPAFYAG